MQDVNTSRTAAAAVSAPVAFASICAPPFCASSIAESLLRGNRDTEEGRSTSGRMPLQSVSIHADALEHTAMQAVFVPIFAVLLESEFAVEALRAGVVLGRMRA